MISSGLSDLKALLIEVILSMRKKRYGYYINYNRHFVILFIH